MEVDVPFDLSHDSGNNNNPNPYGHQYFVKPVEKGPRKSSVVFRFNDDTPPIDTSLCKNYNFKISKRIKDGKFAIGLYSFENVPGTVYLHWTELRQTTRNNVDVLIETVPCLYFYNGEYIRLFIYLLRDNRKPLRIDQYIKYFHKKKFFDIAPLDTKPVKSKLPKGSSCIDEKKSRSILSDAVHQSMICTTKK